MPHAIILGVKQRFDAVSSKLNGAIERLDDAEGELTPQQIADIEEEIIKNE
jgi:hypothetical protein